MRAATFFLALAIAPFGARGADTPAAATDVAEASRAFEQKIAAVVQAPKITVVHFWAPWCPNCKAELDSGGWKNAIARNPDVEFVFITTWNDGFGDGKALLAKYGLGGQKNFQLHLHPNGSRKDEEKLTRFLGLPVAWLPATWIFRSGKIRFALNYGELRFPMLQQLINDSAAGKWDR